MSETLSSGDVSTKLERIATMAKEHPTRAFSSLGHVIDEALLREAYRRTRKGGAPGVDGQTAAQYARTLSEGLASLHVRLKDGSYRAPPVRRAQIPKTSGGSRAIGIPTFEDKVLQRAVSMVLERIYETDFLDGSYGFRPGRSAHDALEALWKGLMSMESPWVLEVDVEKFFDTLSHQHLKEFLNRRVTDGVIRRVLHKWLKAGVLTELGVIRATDGTPQGGVISPLLANIYLHEVLDRWLEEEVRPRLRGRTLWVRYADDFVLVFERRDDAQRVQKVLSKRFGKYGLRLHPEKTRLLQFAPPTDGDERTTFDFLGFTHYWARSRKGTWVVKRRTARDRRARAMVTVRRWCKDHRHDPVSEQHRVLSAKLRGHFNYFGIRSNMPSLEAFRYEARRAWYRGLASRSGKHWPWSRFAAIEERYPLPRPRIVRPKASRETMTARSRMRESRTSGSVGARRE